jgi:hypothetical protein
MISGRLSLHHPALNLRPEFKSQASPDPESSVILFDAKGQTDLGKVLQASAALNVSAAEQLTSANDAYTKAKSSGQSPFEIVTESRGKFRKGWSELKEMSEVSLKTAASLASSASSHLGAVIMGSSEMLAEGVQRIDFYTQTSSEGLIGNASVFAPLTGDSYRSRLEGSISGGKVVTATPLFDPLDDPSGSMVVDTKMGIAVLQDLREDGV